jgi:ankyrin repeat protein
MQARRNSSRTLIWTQPHTIPLPPSKVCDQRQQKPQQQRSQQQKTQQQKSLPQRPQQQETQEQGEKQLQQQQQQLDLQLQLQQVHQNQISQANSVSCPSLGTNSTPRTSPRPQAELAQQQTQLTYETEARTPSSNRDNNKQKHSKEENMQWINGLPTDDLTFDLLSDDAYLKPVQLLGEVSSKNLSDYLNTNKGLGTMACGMEGITERPVWEEHHVPVGNADVDGSGRGVQDDEDDDSVFLEEDNSNGDMEEDYSGFNALHLAASIGQVSTVRLLLQLRPADVDRAAEGGHRHAPLHIASAHHHLDVVRVLLDHGATVRLQDGVGCTALHVAVRAGAHAITRLLVCWCIELLHVRNAAGRTPLHDAIIKGDEEMVRLLLECGADPAAVVAQDSAPGFGTANRS